MCEIVSHSKKNIHIKCSVCVFCCQYLNTEIFLIVRQSEQKLKLEFANELVSFPASVVFRIAQK